jgi:hydrogenase/urease accessory protein HupE
MKKIIISLVLALLVLIPVTISAHELLPKQLVEYIKANPNATPEEIQAYIQNQTPEFAEKVKSKEDVIRIIGKRDTGLLDNLLDFIKLGIQHILSGYDHILFVLSLLLVFISLKTILKLTGTFTIAHSITLILAGTGILTLNPRIVEPLIALSISYVAITTVFLKDRKFIGEARSKIFTVFFFGLFHGLGFAGLLKEIQIPEDRFLTSLIAFNVGIEIGQLIILAVTLPLIYYFRNKSWYPRLIQVFAIIIGGLGIFLAIQRIVGY